MNSVERRAALEAHIGTVHVGDKFSNANELYKKLGLDVDTTNAHTKKNAVQKFLTWDVEKGHSIVITDIFATPLPADGRCASPGGSIGIYQPFIKPLLANYPFDGKSDITYRDIIQACYRIDLTVSGKMDEKEAAHKQRYMREVYNRLRDTTKTALRGLEREGVLKYSEHWLIKRNSSIVITAKVAKVIEDNGNLLEFLRESECIAVLTEALDDDQLIEFLCGALGKDSRALTKNTTLFEFAKMHFNNRPDISKLVYFSEKVDLKALVSVDTLLEAWKVFEETSRMGDAKHATAKETAILETIQRNAIERRGYTTAQFNNNEKCRREVYADSEIVQWLLGMGRVWKGLNVKKNRTTKSVLATYPNEPEKNRDDLMKALESKMKNWVKAVSYNPKTTYDTAMAKKPHWGEIFPGQKEDIEVYYLATDAKLNLWHCKLFGLSPDPDYFSK